MATKTNQNYPQAKHFKRLVKLDDPQVRKENFIQFRSSIQPIK